MKTHQLAKALRELADALANGPDLDLRNLNLASQPLSQFSSSKINVNLDTLLSLARIGKQSWEGYIREMGWAISINPRDSSRDVMGKVLRFLEAHPEARDVIKKRAANEPGRASPELSRALSFLLKED